MQLKMNVKRLLLALVAAACSMEKRPQQFPASEIQAEYELLRDAKVFVGHCSNFPGPLRISDEAHAYRSVLAHPEADKHFKALRESEGIPGQMYGLAGIYFTDPEHLRAAIVPYLEWAEPIASLGGDIQLYTEIKDIAEAIDGGFIPTRLREGECQMTGSAPRT